MSEFPEDSIGTNIQWANGSSIGGAYNKQRLIAGQDKIKASDVNELRDRVEKLDQHTHGSLSPKLVWGPLLITDWLNAFDGPLNFNLEPGFVVVGEQSTHHSYFEDRRFRLYYRKLELSLGDEDTKVENRFSWLFPDWLG